MTSPDHLVPVQKVTNMGVVESWFSRIKTRQVADEVVTIGAMKLTHGDIVSRQHRSLPDAFIGVEVNNPEHASLSTGQQPGTRVIITNVLTRLPYDASFIRACVTCAHRDHLEHASGQNPK